MNAPIIRSAGLAAVLAATFVSLASPARAGHAYGHERHGWRGRSAGDERVVVRDWGSPAVRVQARSVGCPSRVWVRPMSALSVSFSGVVGGVALDGRYDRPLADGCAYADPYCGTTFETLEGYAEHCSHRHPAVVQVISRRDGCDRRDWRERDYDDYDDGD